MLRILSILAFIFVVESKIVYQIRNEVLNEIWVGSDPLSFANMSMVDHGYPHTNIIPEMIEMVLKAVTPTFWLEVGSMLGGSAIKTATHTKKLMMNTSFLSLDPFTGDVNMLAWKKDLSMKIIGLPSVRRELL